MLGLKLIHISKMVYRASATKLWPNSGPTFKSHLVKTKAIPTVYCPYKMVYRASARNLWPNSGPTFKSHLVKTKAIPTVYCPYHLSSVWNISVIPFSHTVILSFDIFLVHFLNENCCIFFHISTKFVPNSPIINIPVLVQIMAWRRTGTQPLSEPMMA